MIEEELKNIFTLQPGREYLRSRESNTVEFKATFHRQSLIEYIKDFAAFANKSGGYLIFGIQNRPHIPIGLKNNQFNDIGEENITETANEHFTPAIEWERYVYEWNGKIFGVIYAYESTRKPVIAIKDGGKGQEIKSGEIYYRYKGRTEKVHYAELIQIIEERIEKERKGWHELFKRIAKIGPENAAILDTVEGKIEKGDRAILIDDELISKLKFIREGQFKEKNGAITLKLIGELQPVSVVRGKGEVIHDDPYKLRPRDVVKQVAKAIDKKFRTTPEHTKCWKYYEVRGTYEEGKVKCNLKYCDYKEALNYFMYTQEWVELLIKELSDSDKYNEILYNQI